MGDIGPGALCCGIGMAVAGAGSSDGAPGAVGIFVVTDCSAAVLLSVAPFRLTLFFFAPGLAGAGIVMPGMLICAAAGAAGARVPNRQSRRSRDFNGSSFVAGYTPRRSRRGVFSRGLAAAVLASAWIAAAAATGGAAAFAIPVCGDGLAIDHFQSPFLVARKRANRHIAPVPWYRVKPRSL